MAIDRSLSEDHVAFGPETPRGPPKHISNANRCESEPPAQELRRAVTPAFRLSRSYSVKPTTTRSNTRRSDASQHSDTSPAERDSQPRQMSGSMSAQTSPRPYETPIFIPQGPHIDPNEPYFGKPPMTPPESPSGSSTFASHKSTTPEPVNAFPGTMSARSAKTKHSGTARERSGFERRKKQGTKAHRWGSVFKGIFTRAQVDRSELESIKDRHWTE